MGLLNWLTSKGNVGGTARAVALGWKTIQSENPSMDKKEIGREYILFRYRKRVEINLAEICSDYFEESEGNPLDLAWAILLAENDDELDYVYSNANEWRKIMSEEISKKGLQPN
jgi:hypothetical protein